MEKFLSKEYEFRKEFIQTANLFNNAFDFETDGVAMSKCYESIIYSIVNFGTCELYARQSERLSILKIDNDRNATCVNQIQPFNTKGLKAVDFALRYLDEYKKTTKMIEVSLKKDVFDGVSQEIKRILSFGEMKPSDAMKIQKIIDDVFESALKGGEKAIISNLEKNILNYKELRLSKTRGTEDNIPIWKAAAIAVIIGIMAWKVIRCLTKGKCCNGIDDKASAVGMTIALLVATYC